MTPALEVQRDALDLHVEVVRVAPHVQGDALTCRRLDVIAAERDGPRFRELSNGQVPGILPLDLLSDDRVALQLGRSLRGHDRE